MAILRIYSNFYKQRSNEQFRNRDKQRTKNVVNKCDIASAPQSPHCRNHFPFICSLALYFSSNNCYVPSMMNLFERFLKANTKCIYKTESNKITKKIC